MSKVLIFVRTSTDSQSTEDQKRELIEFCKSEGYEDIVCVERQGASAAKVDDEYRSMVDEVKDIVDTDKDIDCFAVWHLNRLARTEEMWVEIKNFFVSRGIQILVKNPYLKLLTPDGKVDQGIELAMGLLAILSKQDQSERKAKFRRAKKAMAEKGKYIGGNIIPFGYKVVDGYYCEDEENSNLVRQIFDMYSTGKYSIYTLTKELTERGFPIKNFKLSRILRNKAYTGEVVKGKFDVAYPQIISRELFEKCRMVREDNMIDMKKKGIALGAKLVKCPECGAVCTSNSRHYICCRHAHHGPCSNGLSLKQDVVDELLYRNAYGLHLRWLLNLNEGKMEEYRKELDVLEKKIVAAEKKMDDFSGKKQRIVDTYLEGIISKKDRDARLLKVEDDIRYHKDFISSLFDRKRAIMGLFEKGPGDSVENFMKTYEAMSSEDKYEIIHKHIESLVAVPESYGKRDPRSKRENAVHITIKAIEGSTVEYLYFPMLYQGKQLYILIDGEWVPDTLDGAVYSQEVSPCE